MLPAVALTGFVVPAVRTMEMAVASELLKIPREELAHGDRSRTNRLRTAAWFTTHLGGGALLSGVSLAVPPGAALASIGPFLPGRAWDDDLSRFREQTGGSLLSSPLAPVAGVLALLALGYRRRCRRTTAG